MRMGIASYRAAFLKSNWTVLQEEIRGVFCFVSNVNKERGRRCLVFLEPDKNVDFIMETIRQFLIILHFLDHTYVNLCNVPAALGLERQPWFHGEMERGMAESMMRYEGDFLVRISPNTTNNFVLSGIANSAAKHFLLLDENDLKVSYFTLQCFFLF
ncbi:unnamed protein product [Gongylonema pulchrum]|uniref:SH2 domain-containing protein n=1 Tax=Gongylonema pulchrum TaxID=637853 RepID=A0A183EBR0_9BILA|nr:unnamed protein product [Gongylonema pulchrum]